MSAIIKGMEMPEYCYECPCHNGENGYCQAYKSGYLYSIERPAKCPLIPLPQGHGRLIDADAVTQEAYRRLLECKKYGNEFEKPYAVIRAIETAKTIVPAEGDNADG